MEPFEQPEEKKYKKDKIKVSLPRRVLALKNVDKTEHEMWDNYHKQNIANFPCPCRICVIGPCGVGKTNLCKNILLNARPLYDQVFLIHPDIDYSKEWEDIEPTACMNKIPNISYFSDVIDPDKKNKNICIIDDIEIKGSNKLDERNLGLLMRYLSTHRNMSIIYSHQSWFDVPSIVKKMCNVYIIYRPRSRTELSMIENRCGVAKGLFHYLFNNVASDFRDSICYDLTEGSPARIRKNLFEVIEVDNPTKGDYRDSDDDNDNNDDVEDEEEKD